MQPPVPTTLPKTTTTTKHFPLPKPMLGFFIQQRMSFVVVQH